MKIRKATPHLGADISEIDLSDQLTHDGKTRLRDALHEHGVLFIREQALDAEALLDLARVFGTPIRNSHPKFSAVSGHPEIAIVTNDEQHPPDINVWHTDTTFQRIPAGVCVLKCVETPVEGGDTLWSSMFAALDALSSGLREYLLTFDAEHRLPMDNVPVELLREIGDREVQAIHPIIRWIPERNRESLFVNRTYTKRVLGVHRLESKGILDALFDVIESPDFQVRFRWRENSIAIWDNRITQHFATADYFPDRRTMHRVALLGETPLAARDHR